MPHNKNTSKKNPGNPGEKERTWLKCRKVIGSLYFKWILKVGCRANYSFGIDKKFKTIITAKTFVTIAKVQTFSFI